MGVKLDLTNQKFSKVTAVSFAFIRKHHSYWNCLCDCGNKFVVQASSLISGHTRSCGCLGKAKRFCNRGHNISIVGRYENGICKGCSKITGEAYIEENKDAVDTYHRKYFKDNKDRLREAHLKCNYGITLEDFNKILEKQNNCCLICGINQSELKVKLNVDHDHSCCPGNKSCGKCVRGLLCNHCNLTLGMARDNPKILRKLAEYLEQF
jgi:hypothetical protein